jgi:hypothetical protein
MDHLPDLKFILRVGITIPIPSRVPHAWGVSRVHGGIFPEETWLGWPRLTFGEDRHLANRLVAHVYFHLGILHILQYFDLKYIIIIQTMGDL